MIAPSLLVALLLTGALDDNKAYQEGVTLYQDLEFEQAIFRFEEAALADGLTDGERATVFSWMAMSYAGIGKAAGAKRSLKNALLKDPNVTLPQFAPPKIKEWLDEVKAELGTQAAAREDSARTDESTDDNKASSSDAQSETDSKVYSDADADAPTERVDEFVLEPEQPDESGGGGSVLGGLLMMGGGAGAIIVAAATAVPAALFFYDALVFLQGTLDRIGPDHPDYNIYAQAQQNDYIIGGGLTAVAIVFAAVGLGLLVVGAGTASYGLLE